MNIPALIIQILQDDGSGGGPTPPESDWILATGFWDDDGFWRDDAVWID